eukprot:c5849_g1_i1 orf=190-1368(+)
MIGLGVYVKSSSPPLAPLPDPCGSEILADISSSFTTTSTPTPAQPPPPAGEQRQLLKAPHPSHILKCPRCASSDTKFCYYNNYSLSQPRYFCKNCKRYWTAGGSLRNVPVGGGLRKNKRFKLKLAAEAEAAAIATGDLTASDLSAQQQHYEVKPPSLVVPSSGAMGSCITSTSSVVSGLPANFAGTLPPNFHSTDSIRTSPGSDNCSGSTVEYTGNDNCTGAAAAALLLDQQRNSNQVQHFFRDMHAHVVPPQFYSRYAANITPSNQQYAGSSDEQGASYHAFGYGNVPSSRGMNLHVADEVVGSNPSQGHIYSSGSVAYSAMADSSCEGGDLSSNQRQGIKDEIITTNYPTYDWQTISESLLNGAGTEGFLPLLGGTWPDFSQFQDPSGPG